MDVRHTHYTCATVSVSLSDVVASIEWVSNSDVVASLEWFQIIDVVVAIVLVANSDVVALFEWVQLIDVVVAIVCVCVHHRRGRFAAVGSSQGRGIFVASAVYTKSRAMSPLQQADKMCAICWREMCPHKDPTVMRCNRA